MARLILTHSPAIALLAIIHSVGFVAMYGLLCRNGYLEYLRKLFTEGPFLMPLTGKPILNNFTGIWPLDKLLTLAGILFANVLDGSTPQLSLYGFQFAGQLIPLWTVLIVEGVRAGNTATMFAWWVTAASRYGVGFIMPIYCLLHLLLSPITQSECSSLHRSIDVQGHFDSIAKLPQAFVLGYILPGVLMSVPVFPDHLHQWCAGLWQGFPILIAVMIVFFEKLGQGARNVDTPEQRTVPEAAYNFALICASMTQLTSYAILVWQSCLPWSLANDNLTFTQVFLPPPFWRVEPMPNPAIGIMNFFQYDQYVACAAGIVWASTLYTIGREQRLTKHEQLELAGRMLRTGIIAGPACVVLELVRARDHDILAQ